MIFSAVAASVEVTRGISQDSDNGKERLNHKSVLTPSGLVYAYDSGPTIIRGVININFVNETEADALKNWIVNVIRFAYTPFTLTPRPHENLGRGPGVALGFCHWDGEATTRDAVRRRGQANKYDITFPYFTIEFDTIGVPAEPVGG